MSEYCQERRQQAAGPHRGDKVPRGSTPTRITIERNKLTCEAVSAVLVVAEPHVAAPKGARSLPFSAGIVLSEGR
jgi:hypothetical protein